MVKRNGTWKWFDDNDKFAMGTDSDQSGSGFPARLDGFQKKMVIILYINYEQLPVYILLTEIR